MEPTTKQLSNVCNLYNFKQLFTSDTEMTFVSEQILYLIEKNYQNKNISSFVSFLLNLIFKVKKGTIIISFNKQFFDLSKENYMIFLDPIMKNHIINILDTVKLGLENVCDFKYNLNNLHLSQNNINFNIFVNFDEK